MLLTSWNILVELAPWMLLGMAIAGALHTLLPPRFIQQHLGGRGAVGRAVAFGVPLPLCSCGVIPAGLGLKKDGASDGAAIAFLVSTPQTGVDSILVSGSFLGWPFALLKVVGAALTGVTAGWITEIAGGPRQPIDGEAGTAQPPGDRNLRAGLDHGLTLLRTIWRWLLFGVLVSAAIELYVPNVAFETLTAQGNLAAMLGVLVISLPLYVCATASVPIAAALVAGGLPVGAALVFLMAGPASNVATIGAVYRGFGARVLTIYLGTIVVGSVICGLFFDMVIDPQVVSGHVNMTHSAWWQVTSGILLAGFIAIFAVQDAQRWWTSRINLSAQAIELPVSGMTCGGCVSRLEGLLGKLEGAERVRVDLEPGRAIVQGSVNEATVRQVIEQAGFDVA